MMMRELVAVDMMKYLFVAVLVGCLSFVADTETTASPADMDSCKLPLPVGCSCVQDRTAISVECSGAQMTSVPKHWFGSGNLVVKTLNLERNNISEVGTSTPSLSSCVFNADLTCTQTFAAFNGRIC